MRQLNVAGMLTLMLTLSWLLSLRALAAGDANITPVVTVAPTLLTAGQAAHTYLCSLI
jgi:hypothetical protein